MTFTLHDAAVALSAVAVALPSACAVSRFSIDSRTLEPGALFFALRSETADGHDYLAAAFARGAAAAVVDHQVPGAGPQLVVPDTLAALQTLGAWARRRWDGQIIAVTGSAGKTTTKEAIHAALSAAGPADKSLGNFNNHLGVPLTLLHLTPESPRAVLEIGMNHAGEIRRLASLARPQIAVVTNSGSAHIQNFDDGRDGIARAKRELVEALTPEGVAVLNADDTRVAAFASAHPGRTITYGLSADADLRARSVEYLEDGVRFHVEGVGAVTCGVPGPAGVMAALAALAAARAAGLDPARVAPAVARVRPGPMRAERVLRGGLTIWNDCYNSNPEAVRMMLDLLVSTPASRRIAVLGEMLELGRWSKALHEEVGNHAAACGVSVLVGIRGAARNLVDAARQAGLAADAASFFEDPRAAGLYLRSLAQPGDAILFKGSRGTRVELALQSFWGEE